MRKVRSRFALYPHPMYTVTYYKLGNAWFLDLPEYTGPSADLERVGSFHDFLELAARGQTTLVFHVDTKPFQDADVMQLREKGIMGLFSVREISGFPIYNPLSLLFLCTIKCSRSLKLKFPALVIG